MLAEQEWQSHKDVNLRNEGLNYFFNVLRMASDFELT